MALLFFMERMISMKECLAAILAVICSILIVCAAVAFSYSCLFAVAYIVCAVVNFFVGYELFGITAIALIALLLFVLGWGGRRND